MSLIYQLFGRLETCSNPAIKELYQRLTAAGKCHKVAITACMRKLLIVTNAMLRDQMLWQQN